MVAPYGENGIGKVRRKGALAFFPLWVSLIGSVWLSEVLEANVAELRLLTGKRIILSCISTNQCFPRQRNGSKEAPYGYLELFSPLITSGGRPSKLPRTSILLSREGGFICKEHLFLLSNVDFSPIRVNAIQRVPRIRSLIL